MKVLLVNPSPILDSYNVSLAGAQLFASAGIASRVAPISIATIAGLTPEEHEVHVHDENVYGPVDSRILEGEYDVVGTSVLNSTADRALEICRIVREHSHSAVAVLGGPGVPAIPQEELNERIVRVIGEAEVTWPRFLKELEGGAHSNVYRQVSKLDLAECVPPRWSLLGPDIHRYLSTSVQTTRGCPHDCDFCDVTYLFGRRVRQKPIPVVLKEIRSLASLGAGSIFVADDNFVANKAYTRRLLHEIIALNRSLRIPIQFTTQIDVTIWRDDELLGLLADANFACLYIGLESPNPDTLAELNKKQNRHFDLAEAVKKIQSYGVLVHGLMMLGSDVEDESCFGMMSEFLSRAHIAFHSATLVFAYPGTRLWYRVKEEGRLVSTLPKSQQQSNSLDHLGITTAITNIEPRKMTRIRMLESYADFLDETAEVAHFAERAKALLRDAKRAPGIAKPSLRQLWVQRKLAYRILKWALFGGGADIRRLFFALLRTARKHAPFMLPKIFNLLAHYCLDAARARKIAENARRRASFEREGAPNAVFAENTDVPIPEVLRHNDREMVRLAFETVRPRVTGREALYQGVTRGIADYILSLRQPPASLDPDSIARLTLACTLAVEGLDGRAPAGNMSASGAVPPGFVGEVLNEVDRLVRERTPHLYRAWASPSRAVVPPASPISASVASKKKVPEARAPFQSYAISSEHKLGAPVAVGTRRSPL